MLGVVLLLALAVPALAQQPAFDVQTLLKLARVSDPQVSPDGKSVAFTVQTVDLAANTKPGNIYVVPVDAGSPVRITNAGGVNQRPRWSPDSKSIAFISDRGGSSQVWLMDADGKNPRQITTLSTEADGVTYSPDGKNLVFTSEVYPQCGADDICNKRESDADSSSKVQARIYTSLLYRHWTRWQTRKRSHLFVVPVAGGTPQDLTPGVKDVPPFSLGGPDDYAISPDGAELCYAMISDAEPAVSTNSDLYVVPMTGGEPKKVTSNPGADNSPAYSPDGKFLAWRTQLRPGYESDRWRLVVLDRANGKLSSLTDGVDRWVTGFTWAADSKQIFFTVEDRGRQGVQVVAAAGGGARSIITGNSTVDELQVTADNKTLVYTEQTGSRPSEIYAAAAGGTARALTHFNDALLARLRLPALEEFSIESPDGARIHTFLVKPLGFAAGQKYPVLFLIHGGPQGAWGESWTYRWNAQVFASAGFVVMMPNPRGSTGYGQKFVDEINQDWGGKAFDDIMAVVGYAEKLPYADPDKFAAAGGSYGGYMVDWLLGHTQRFKALVSHDGVYDLESEFGETEELWFPLWEFAGTPWNNPEVYAKWSPSHYAKDFATPTLVFHGALDFRVPLGQGLHLFTALQMQKVPSKLVVFPDEGHWVLKPQNSVLWYTTFIDWVKEWVNKPPAQPPATPAVPGVPTAPAAPAAPPVPTAGRG
jgi:dipeptidyl aminopeptidase/acylaminoacyl peptidase